jgi:hypothetical protein
MDIDMGLSTWDMGYRFGIPHFDMFIYNVDMVILNIDLGYGLMIWEMTVSILSSSVSRWDILSLCCGARGGPPRAAHLQGVDLELELELFLSHDNHLLFVELLVVLADHQLVADVLMFVLPIVNLLLQWHRRRLLRRHPLAVVGPAAASGVASTAPAPAPAPAPAARGWIHGLIR